MDGVKAALAVDQWTDESVTAVCAYNDETAMAVLAGMHLRGLRAPDEIAVIGVGDIAAAQVSIPPLSTIGLDYEETGRNSPRPSWSSSWPAEACPAGQLVPPPSRPPRLGLTTGRSEAKRYPVGDLEAASQKTTLWLHCVMRGVLIPVRGNEATMASEADDVAARPARRVPARAPRRAAGRVLPARG